MKYLTLKEFAHGLYNRGNAQEMEFAKEILDLVLAEETSDYAEIIEGLDHYAAGIGAPTRQIECLGDRSNLLTEIDETLTAAEYATTGTEDAHDHVKAMIEQIEFLLTEIDALKAPTKSPRWSMTCE